MNPTQVLMVLATLLLTVPLGFAAVAIGNGLRLRGLRQQRFSVPLESARAAPGGAAMALFSGVQSLGRKAAIQDPTRISEIRDRLMRAGFHSREAVMAYLGIRALALFVATLGTVLLLPMALKAGGMGPVLLACLLAVAALLGPDQVLKMRRTAREREYADGFPDLLDLLVASVEAGLSLDAAVARITEELERRYPWLSVHLRLLTLELRAGKSRKEAWATLADRLGIEDARSLATMLRQAEEMGTSLGDTLSVFAQDMRAKRMLRAEEKALALPVKLTVPLILFIFPCLLGVLLLPAVFRLMQSFGGN